MMSAVARFEVLKSSWPASICRTASVDSSPIVNTIFATWPRTPSDWSYSLLNASTICRPGEYDCSLNGPLAYFSSRAPVSIGFIGVPTGTGHVVGSAVL